MGCANSKTNGAAAVAAGKGSTPQTLKHASISTIATSSFSHEQSSFQRSHTGNNVTTNVSGGGAVKHTLEKKQPTSESILGLSVLRRQNANDKDIAKAVVRIGTPDDVPIEENYDGVLTGQTLGSGAFGTVRRVTHRTTGLQYAVKCIDLVSSQNHKDHEKMEMSLLQLRNEIAIMCQLDHPNIVRIEEVYFTDQTVYIVQELCTGGDPFDRLSALNISRFSEAQAATMVKEMLSAIRYLHSKGIVHRDLKLENFLFSSSDKESEIKMIDFGFSKHFEAGEHLCEKVGTPYTVAPEVIMKDYDEKCDMWSLGVVMYVLLSDKAPFGGLSCGEDPQTVALNIRRGTFKFAPASAWELISDECKQFVSSLLNTDPKKRPSAEEAQISQWMQRWTIKGDNEEINALSPKTIKALMEFKNVTQMQQRLFEVLSFTLRSEQIVQLRKEFQKLDLFGDGEISVEAFKRALIGTTDASLTELDVEAMFDSLRVQKSASKVSWHEFLAASISSENVDDRNMRLAFNRLDSQRRGFFTCDELSDTLGHTTDDDVLQKIWRKSLDGLESRLDVITLDNFKALIRGKRDVPTTTQLLLEKNPQYDRESEGKLEEENDLSGRRVSCFFMDDKDENFMFDHISASCSAGDLGVARMRSTLKQQGLMPPLSSNRVYHCPSIPPNLLPSSKLLEKCTMSTTLAEEQLQEATLMDIKFA